MRWLALLSLSAIVPAALAAHLMHDVVVLVMKAKAALDTPTPAGVVAGMRLDELSAYISTRLVIAVLGGGLFSAWLAALALLNLLPMRGAISDRVAAYGWIAAAAALGIAAWLIVRFWTALRWFGTLS